jgi:hypothetical protein
VALEIRPNCELCDRDLPAASTAARICSYECTFCARCVDEVLHNVCPNCGGGFAPRPIRPQREWRPGLSLAQRPGLTHRARTAYTREQIQEFSARIRQLAPQSR